MTHFQPNLKGINRATRTHSRDTRRHTSTQIMIKQEKTVNAVIQRDPDSNSSAEKENRGRAKEYDMGGSNRTRYEDIS